MKLSLFYWKGKNHLQQKQRGLIVAENQAIAQRELFQRGLRQVTLQKNWQFPTKPKPYEICDLVMQLSVLLQASVTLKQSLQILLQNCINLSLNRWLRLLIQDLEAGLSFSQALEKQERYFTYQEQQLIKAGEMSGNLPLVCEQIALHRQQSLQLQRKIQKILFYPAIVLTISLILTTLLLIFIVPQFAEMYGEQTKLPFFTTLLLNLSTGLQKYFIQFFLLFFLIFLFIQLQLKKSYLLNKWKNTLISAAPVLKNIVRLSRLVNFSSSLSLMLRSGIPLNQALQSFLPKTKSWQVSQKLQGDIQLIEEIKSILYWINQGYSFSESVSSNLFSIQAQQMLQIGEKSGKLATMLQHIAENNQQRLNHQADLLSQMLEPILMLLIGSIIGLIMLGMYLPIFNMGAIIQ
ncbi:type II secretion system F family protein [Seminibacterium arietis]|uniref:Type II secretion system F family protein n=1 Tax=Seminibacterium arietis TaxID=1173502 RepID=A0ABW3I7D5_9PAST